MIDVVPIEKLSPADEAKWLELLKSSSGEGSAFLTPWFARIASKFINPVEVVILRDDNTHEPVGFLGVERPWQKIARATAFGYSDMQGVVAKKNVVTDTLWPQLLDALHCEVLEFDHLISSQAPESAHKAIAPVVEMPDGIDVYFEKMKVEHAKSIKKFEKKGKKLQSDAEEEGGLHFRYRDDRADAVNAIAEWKSAQYKRSGYHDLFADGWYKNFVTVLSLGSGSGQFEPIVSTLSVGERIIAAQIGFVCNNVMSAWITAFDREYNKNSPGIAMLFEIWKAASNEGVVRYEFGKGDEDFKLLFATHFDQVASAWFLKPGLVSAMFWMRKVPRFKTEQFILRHPALRLKVRKVVASLGRLRGRGQN